MSDFKEFQGKGLDEAIESACNYFNLKRERLEIEITAGGSSGIFGIMGVKKSQDSGPSPRPSQHHRHFKR